MTHLRAMLCLVALLLCSAAGAQQPELVASPAISCAPGRIDLRVQIAKKDCICLFLTAGGGSGGLRVPGVRGLWRLQGPLAYAGIFDGPRTIRFPVPASLDGTHVWFQGLLLGPQGARLSNVARSTVLTVDVVRRSPPRGPQAEDRVNVGQWVRLEAKVRPPDLASSAGYTWSVEGKHARDYVDDLNSSWGVIAMRPADYRRRQIEMYWLPDSSQMHPRRGAPIARRVAVTVQVGEYKCVGSRRFGVERNGDHADLQAEDFYCEYNHLAARGRGSPPTFVLNQHADWHVRNDWYLWPPCGPQIKLYVDFLHHHGHMLERFSAWRQVFGYAPLVEWDPGKPIPTGPDIDHAGRKTSDPKYPIPTYLTANGGTTPSKCFKRRKLGEFKDLGELSPETAQPWHFGVHVTIGGDMASTTTSPKDPVFWRFHLFIERHIHRLWHTLTRK